MFAHNLIIPMTVELTKICRTCLGIEGKLLSIYQTKGISNVETVSDMLKALTTIPPEKYDGFPENVCLDCIREINLCYLFKLKCEHSYSIFKQIVNGNPEQAQVIPNEDKIPNTNSLKSDSDVKNQAMMPVVPDNFNFISTVPNESTTQTSCSVLCPDDKAKEQETKIEPVNDTLDTTKEESICSNTFEGIIENMVFEEDVDHTDDENGEPIEDSNTVEDNYPSEDSNSIADCTSIADSVLACADSTKILDVENENSTQELLSLLERAITHNNGTQSNHGEENGDHSVNNTDKNKSKANKEVVKKYPITSKKNKDPKPCDICGKVFQLFSSLHNHKRTHSEERPYSCRFCGKTFRVKFCQREHELRHLSNKTFQCEKCDKSFVTSKEIKTHNLVHNNEYPFTCALCCRGFRYGNSLKRHIRSHTGEKPYVCSHCPKKYSTLVNLKTHHTIHEDKGIDIKEINECRCCKGLIKKSKQGEDLNL